MGEPYKIDEGMEGAVKVLGGGGNGRQMLRCCLRL